MAAGNGKQNRRRENVVAKIEKPRGYRCGKGTECLQMTLIIQQG